MVFTLRLENRLNSEGIMIPKKALNRIMRFQQQIADLCGSMTIPRWARVALAARTVRRVQPFLLATWPKAPKKFVLAVEMAVAEAERAAGEGAVTPDQTAVGMAAMDAYGTRPMDVGVAGDIAFAAAHGSFSARGSTGEHALFVVETAIGAVHSWESRGSRGLLAAALKAAWEDLRHLKSIAKAERWNNKTPVSPEVFGPMWPEGPPTHWPAISPALTPAKPRNRTNRVDVDKFHLPHDLMEFLRAGRNLEYDPAEAECGLVVLKRHTHLRLGQCGVTTEGTSVHSKDPHRGEDGEYLVKTVELVGECDAYDPEGLLTWFPDFRCYGCWDLDHHMALVFPKTKWSDIVADAAEFLNAQWDGSSEIAKPMTPWKHGKFKARN